MQTTKTEQHPVKWNSLLKTCDEPERMGKVVELPAVQSNHRLRSESVPEIATQGMKPENSLLLSTFSPDTASLSQMLDFPLRWDTMEGNTTPLSPLRSPIVADWKAVGSPIGPITPNDDSLFDGIMDTSSLASGQTSGAAGDSPERNGHNRMRRQRAMSLIEKTVYGNGGKYLFADAEVERYRRATSGQNVADTTSAGNKQPWCASDEHHAQSQNGMSMTEPPAAPISPIVNKLATGRWPSEIQVAQLPQMLHEALGIENTEEATELIKRAAEGSEDTSPAKPLGSMVNLFGSMPFGPAAMIFGGSLGNKKKAGELENECSRENSHENELRESDLYRRRSSLLNLLPDFDGFEVGSKEISVDDYFKTSNLANMSKSVMRRHPRRHSIAATEIFSEFDENFGSLSLAANESPSGLLNHSGLSATAAAFQFQGFSPSNVSSASTLLDMMSNGDFASSACRYQPPISSASMMKEASFQLSTYKGPLYAVEFKAGRTEIFYVLEVDGDPQLQVKVGDLVIVEADRGEDLGKVTIEISVDKLKQLMMPGSRGSPDKDSDILTPELAALVHSKEIVPKRIHRLAQPADLKLLQAKAQEEAIAMVRCQSRIRQKKLPMEVVDAEYQWDRNKLTFYFCADRRIDFRELVRDLFRIYKTRIWMCAVDKTSPRMLMYSSPCGSTMNSLNGPLGNFNSHTDMFDEDDLGGLSAF